LGPVNFSLPMTVHPNMSYAGASMGVSCIWWPYPIDYTGGCAPPANGVQSCSYNFYARRAELFYKIRSSPSASFYDAPFCNGTYFATGNSYDLPLGSITFSYTPAGAYLNTGSAVNNCEALARSNSCQLSASVCLDNAIQSVNGVSFSPPGGCWDTNNSYSCLQSTDQSACTQLLNQGYIQVASGACVNKDLYGNCTAMQYTLNRTTSSCVASRQVVVQTAVIQGGCASQNTADCNPKPGPSTMPNALANIYAITSAVGLTGNPLAVFPPTDINVCRTDILFGTFNCCSNSTSLVNPNCSAGEIKLSQEIAAGQCQEVNVWQSNCSVIGCVLDNREYCCYGSQLSLLIQQGFHSQLGIPWVTGGAAYCPGITPAQLQMIDFSKIDFTPVFSLINSKAISGAQLIQNEIQNQTAAPVTCPACLTPSP
jgi:type IV conjugative transfer system TraN protein involved in mating pair stabilization